VKRKKKQKHIHIKGDPRSSGILRLTENAYDRAPLASLLKENKKTPGITKLVQSLREIFSS